MPFVHFSHESKKRLTPYIVDQSLSTKRSSTIDNEVRYSVTIRICSFFILDLP